MTTSTAPTAGSYRLGERDVPRIGYGAMQLTGPRVFGPPKDRDEALAVLRTAVELGIRHIDTADFYGPFVVNELIREALSPYPDDLVIVTKVGARRDAKGGWPPAREPEDLVQQVHENLERLGVEALDVVNLRMGGQEEPVAGTIARQFEALAELREQGLIRELGVSNVDGEQIAEARTIAPIVCVQNRYNLANRADDRIVDLLADEEIAYVPYFPLGGFSPIQSSVLDEVAADLKSTPMAVAIAWLLQRSPNVLLIPGTSSVAHLRDNITAGALELPADAVAKLNSIAG